MGGKRLLGSALILGLGIYLAGIAVLYVNQRRFLFVGSIRSGAQPAVPPGYSDVRLAAADGTILRAWYKAPVRGRPVVMFFHGNGDTIAGSAVAVRPFIARGYGVLLPEYRGYGGMPGKPSEDASASDARTVHSWLTTQGLDDGQIVVIGYSLGAGVATQLATEIHPRALILFAAFASVDHVAATKLPIVPVRWLLTEHFDNEAKLSSVAAPLLLLHGTADRTVPYDNLGRLKRARRDATAVTFSHVDHSIVFQSAPVERALTWLESLPKPAPL